MQVSLKTQPLAQNRMLVVGTGLLGRRLCEELLARGHIVETTSDCFDAATRVTRDKYQLVILDEDALVSSSKPVLAHLLMVGQCAFVVRSGSGAPVLLHAGTSGELVPAQPGNASSIASAKARIQKILEGSATVTAKFNEPSSSRLRTTDLFSTDLAIEGRADALSTTDFHPSIASPMSDATMEVGALIALLGDDPPLPIERANWLCDLATEIQGLANGLGTFTAPELQDAMHLCMLLARFRSAVPGHKIPERMGYLALTRYEELADRACGKPQSVTLAASVLRAVILKYLLSPTSATQFDASKVDASTAWASLSVTLDMGSELVQ